MQSFLIILGVILLVALGFLAQNVESWYLAYKRERKREVDEVLARTNRSSLS